MFRKVLEEQQEDLRDDLTTPPETTARVSLERKIARRLEVPVILKLHDHVPQVAVGNAAKDFEPDWQQIGIVADLHLIPRYGLSDGIGLPPLRELVRFVLELDQASSRIFDQESSRPHGTVVFPILREGPEAAIRRSLKAVRQ